MDPRQRPHQHQHPTQRPRAPASAPPTTTPAASASPPNSTSAPAAASLARHQASSSPAASASSFAHAADHRRTSDTPYFSPAARSGLPSLGHARAQSASCLPPARQLGRSAMAPPPPSPPSQQAGPPLPLGHHQQQKHTQHTQHAHHHQVPPHPHPHPHSHPHPQLPPYPPPPPRPPPVAVGPPTAFPSGRELPALGSSLPRAASAAGSSMSISSMLGGPLPGTRDVASSAPQHYQPSTAAPSAAVSGPGYHAPAVHASPRMPLASSEYSSFRRPQTPDHQRSYDPRAGAAPSPRGNYSAPDLQRYGTPQAAAYHARHPPGPAEASREAGRMSAGSSSAPVNAPSKPYSTMPPRPAEFARSDDAYGRREDGARSATTIDYNPDRPGPRPYAYDDQYRTERERPPPPEQREGRDTTYPSSDSHRHTIPPHDMGRREPPHPAQTQYGRPTEARDPRDSREAYQWGRHGADSYRVVMEPARQPSENPSASGPFASHHAAAVYQPQPQPQPLAERYSAPPLPLTHPPSTTLASQPYEQLDRSRVDHAHQQLQQHSTHRPRPVDDVSPPPPPQPPPPPPPSMAYPSGQAPSPFDASRHRTADEVAGPGGHQRNLLAVQDISRKGRLSPLPQAVQGAQPQQSGPAAEPGIKSEFGRMFSGIGSGVSAIGVSSSVASGPGTAYGHAPSASGTTLGKREEADHGAADSGAEMMAKSKGRRRKVKDDESRGDEEAPGGLTPSGRANKRQKAHGHHHHQYVIDRPLFVHSPTWPSPTDTRHSHHHHHYRHAPEVTSQLSGGLAAYKNLKGGPSAASPTDKAAPAPPHHHHHHHHHHASRAGTQTQGQAARQAAQTPETVIPPRPKLVVSSKSVLESVAHRPRHHLGDFVYEARLEPARRRSVSQAGFCSNPKPLPWDMIKDNENCTLTVKVPRIHLSAIAREEITARAYLWGTDVYTDDSDVVAACIHAGWIKGQWATDVDNSHLDLVEGGGAKAKEGTGENMVPESEEPITSPPASGPLAIPADRDLQVNVLILPRLTKYSATVRYGIASREFGGMHSVRHSIHDGLSYMISSIRWVKNGGQPQARLRGKARRDRMRKAMDEVTASFGNTNGQEHGENRRGQQQKQQEMAVNQSVLRCELSSSWCKGDANKGSAKDGSGGKEGREPGEGDKENRLAHDKAPAQPAQEATAASASGLARDLHADAVRPEQDRRGVDRERGTV